MHCYLTVAHMTYFRDLYGREIPDHVLQFEHTVFSYRMTLDWQVSMSKQLPIYTTVGVSFGEGKGESFDPSQAYQLPYKGARLCYI